MDATIEFFVVQLLPLSLDVLLLVVLLHLPVLADAKDLSVEVLCDVSKLCQLLYRLRSLSLFTFGVGFNGRNNQLHYLNH